MKNKTSILTITLILFLGYTFTLNAAMGFNEVSEEKAKNAQTGLAKLLAYMQWIIGQEQQLGGITGKKKETVNTIKKNVHEAWHSIDPLKRSRIEYSPNFQAIFENTESETKKLLDRVDWDREGSEKPVLADIKKAEKDLIDAYGKVGQDWS